MHFSSPQFVLHDSPFLLTLFVHTNSIWRRALEMMETEMLPETWTIFNELTRLIDRENFTRLIQILFVSSDKMFVKT
jgi:hypothetical protein